MVLRVIVRVGFAPLVHFFDDKAARHPRPLPPVIVIASPRSDNQFMRASSSPQSRFGWDLIADPQMAGVASGTRTRGAGG